MKDYDLIVYIAGMILLWLGGYIAGKAKGKREEAVRRQEEEFAKERAALYVPPLPPFTEEEKALIKRALEEIQT